MQNIASPKLLIALLLLMPNYLEASHNCQEPVAKVVSIQGRVEIQPAGSSTWRRIHLEDELCDGDLVRTAKWSRATIIRPSGSGFTMPQNGTLSVSAPPEANKQPTSWYVKILQGAAFFRSRQPEQFNIQTPFFNAVHKGTEFLVEVGDDNTTISVFDGLVSGENKAGKVEISKGYQAIARANSAPKLQALTITPEDAVQWALYYPPIIDDSQRGGNPGDNEANAALDAYRQGDIIQALEKLENFKPTQQTASTLTLKAAMLLSVGRVDEAQALIRQTQQQDTNNSDAFALEAIIAIAKNRGQAALAAANQAVAGNPKSSVAFIAQSYAYQSLFNIEAALKSTQEATRLTPDNALAWAREAELHLSQGDKKAALAAAQKAQTLNPQLARTQTVLGFANLAQTDIEPAIQAFSRALNLDSTDPLARLGLGLAKIRKGDIAAGKVDLETAVNLDPNNAVARSYLGKAYYELKDKDFAAKELDIAKAMDPKDPTPYFYDAILKQTTNRPVAALHNMQKAIDLNDNRGVYRSSLLLDKDSAARSAAQGRIYNELGFQQRGLLEGWKSVNTDHSNYSAHRLLADNYAALPRHEIARVSELLQSQLMQPVNITPIQPNLADNEMFILNGFGPSDFSFNEFNPLFEYNRYALQSSGMYGSNGTWGDNTTLSGLHDNVSFSLGQFHYDTNGFRENNYLRKNLYNAFVQSQVTDDLNLQAEYRHEESKNGDLSLNFNLDNFSKDLTRRRTLDSYRIGGRYTISPNSSLIASVIYQDRDTRQSYDEVGAVIPGLINNVLFDDRSNRKGFIAEIQHYYNHSHFSLISGLNHVNRDSNDTVTDTLVTTFGNFSSTTNATGKTRNTSFYNYLKYYFTKQLTVTLGLAVDFIDSDNAQRTPVNPKLGFEWKPTKSTTIRAAGFRTSGIYQTVTQTIQPTQVAGFNQFFDERDGTLSWRYGAGIDHRFNENLSIGAEYTERRLNIPGGFDGVERTEQLARSYLYLTPHDSFSVAAEYYYEKIDQPSRSIIVTNLLNNGSGLYDTVETHRLPLTLSWFHESGFSFKIRNTYVQQKGVFQDLATLTSIPGKTSFILTDMNLSYRLPKRYGILTLGINNLFDHRILFQNTNLNETLLAPERLLFSRISVAF